MKLQTLREFPICVRPIELAAGDGIDPRAQFLALTRDQLFELLYRVRRFRITVDMTMTTPQGEQVFVFTSPEPPEPDHENHVYNPDISDPLLRSPSLTSERDLACLGQGIYHIETYTPQNDSRVVQPAGNPDHGEATGSAFVTWGQSFLYWDASAALYYWDFTLSITLEVASTAGPGGTIALAFTAAEEAEDAPPVTLSLPWGQVLHPSGVVKTPDVDVSGSAALVFTEWWPFADPDGSEPWRDASTGAPIAPNPRALT